MLNGFKGVEVHIYGQSLKRDPEIYVTYIIFTVPICGSP